jgi:hypothetical protein
MTTPAVRFKAVVDGLANDSAVTAGKMFGSTALKVNGKVFAMLVRDKLVVKVPRARAAILIEAGHGEAFDPGHGKVMKEWVAVGPDQVAWVTLASEARKFVAGGC